MPDLTLNLTPSISKKLSNHLTKYQNLLKNDIPKLIEEFKSISESKVDSALYELSSEACVFAMLPTDKPLYVIFTSGAVKCKLSDYFSFNSIRNLVETPYSYFVFRYTDPSDYKHIISSLEEDLSEVIATENESFTILHYCMD